MTAPAKELDWKAYVRGELKRWADYINMLRVREITRHTPVGSMMAEAVDYSRNKKSLEAKYPYQPYVYLCKQCDKPHLKKPERCGKCGRWEFSLVREGVTGRRVFASMIRATGRDKWEHEVRIDEAVKQLPDDYYRIVKLRYCDDHMTQERMARAEGCSLRTFQNYLYEGECMVYGMLTGEQKQ